MRLRVRYRVIYIVRFLVILAKLSGSGQVESGLGSG